MKLVFRVLLEVCGHVVSTDNDDDDDDPMVMMFVVVVVVDVDVDDDVVDVDDDDDDVDDGVDCRSSKTTMENFKMLRRV
mgnify:CR=1 FL=1